MGLCACSQHRSAEEGLSHLRVVCFTFHQIFLTQIIIHEVFILIISYVTHVISHAFQRALHMLSVLITQI